MKKPVSNVGKLVRKRREEMGISLRNLSQLCGLSASFLSQLEYGKVNISINSLHRLADAMGVDILYFFLNKPTQDPQLLPKTNGGSDPLKYSPVILSGMRPKMVFPGTGLQLELLIPNLGRKMVAVCGSMGAGNQNVARKMPEPTEEFLYVLQGKLYIGLERGEYILSPGDTIYFEGEKMREMRCVSENGEDAMWISVITPAVF